MNVNHPTDENFISTLTEIILLNLGKDNFGVKELARAAGMSTFSLRRKLGAVSNKSINQLIREVRLQKAMEMLQQEDVTASEVAYKVGFGSPAYFTKCFHDYFGYPPGEAKTHYNGNFELNSDILPDKSAEEKENKSIELKTKNPKTKTILITSLIILLLFSIYIIVNNLPYKSFSLVPGNKLKSGEKSVAVLPLKNLSGEEENQFFADGVTENILYNLINIRELKVINNPAKEFSENPKDFRKIAKSLGIRFILWGSVQRADNNVLIIAKLTDTRNNELIWSEKYDKKLEDIFQIQSDIAKQVASELQTIIPSNEKERIEKIPTTNKEAHAYYLMGKYLLERRGWRDPDTTRYISSFKKAIALDPNYAEAYAGLAETYLILTQSKCYPRPEGYIKAKENVLKALKLDNSLVEGHTTLGAILYWHEWKWEEARKELELAMELNPNYAVTHDYYASLMCRLRQREIARSHVLRAAELNPVSPYLILNKASVLDAIGKPEQALEEYNKFIEIYPDNYSVYYHLWEFYLKKGEDLKAMESLQKAFQLVPEDKPFVDTIKVIYNKQGIKGLEKWHIEHIIKYDAIGSWQGIVRYYIKIGEKEKALEWIEKGWEWKIPRLPAINSWSDLDLIQNEPRFQALLDSMGLTPYQ